MIVRLLLARPGTGSLVAQADHTMVLYP